MATIPRTVAAIQTLLTTVADEAARATGFVRRRSKLSGAAFVQTLVFGWLSAPDATLEDLRVTAGLRGAVVSRQAIAQRFSMAAAACLQQVLEQAVSRVLRAPSVPVPILQRFTAVWVQDSTTISLPAALAARWPGCGGSTPTAGQAAVKLQVRLDLVSGALEGPYLEAGCAQDRASALQHAPIAAGALRIADLGYFSLDVLRALAAAGSYWLSRYQVQTAVFTEAGARWELAAWLRRSDPAVVEQTVTLGVDHRLRCRLLAVRVPSAVAAERRRKLRAEAQRAGRTANRTKLALADWTVLLTNVPADLLRVDEAVVLARARWQIELLFKLWKSQGQVDAWRTADPARILCELYAKLLALVVQHWVLLATCWQFPDRSLPTAARTIQKLAPLLASAFDQGTAFTRGVRLVAQCLAAGARVGRRRTKPATHQLLLALPASLPTAPQTDPAQPRVAA